MKTVFLFIIFFISDKAQAQTWTTLNTAQMGNAQANQANLNPGFKLDVYRNDLWYIADLTTHKVSCFHLNDGTVDIVDFASGQAGGYFDVAFTPSSAFFMSFNVGLYKINSDYTISIEYTANYGTHLYQNGDTIYMVHEDGFLRYTENGSLGSTYVFERIVAKGTNFYPSNSYNSSLKKFNGTGYVSYSTVDNEYLCGQFNDIKFSPYSDTIYVACAAGVSVGVNYDFVDSITPENTINMPSANVLEFEFDLENRMWACFGDVNGDAFALARLDGDTWTNYYDVNNSPINFASYRGIEIDTTGNLWVAATSKTYLLDLGETPVWLGTSEFKEELITLAPNPALDACVLSFPTMEERTVSVVNLQGQVLATYTSQTESFSMDLNGWAKGNYLVVIESPNGKTVKQLNKQ